MNSAYMSLKHEFILWDFKLQTSTRAWIRIKLISYPKPSINLPENDINQDSNVCMFSFVCFDLLVCFVLFCFVLTSFTEA